MGKCLKIQRRTGPFSLRLPGIYIAQVTVYQPSHLLICPSLLYSERLLLFFHPGYVYLLQNSSIACAKRLVLYLPHGIRPRCVLLLLCIFKIINSNTLKQSRDNTWDSVPLVIWGFVEQHLAIIAACIPCLKALFRAKLT